MWLDKILAKKGAPYLLLGLAILLVWGHTVTFGFVWDDNNFIVENQSIRSLKNLPRMFYDVEAQTTLPHEFLIFRPLRNVQYTFLYLLGGEAEPQPWIYHAANVVWHFAVCGMLFSIALILLRKQVATFTEDEARRWAFLTALAFAVHPTTSEVVCWAKGLDDLMVSFFVLCALRELLLWEREKRNYLRSLFFFALALYSKESAVPFSVIPYFVFLGIQKIPFRKNILLSSGFIGIAILYFAHRYCVLGRSTQIEPLSGGYGQTLIDMFPVVTKYFRLLWGVPPFFVDYSYMQGGEPFFSVAVMTGLILLVGLIVIGILAWRKNSFRLIGFGLLWTGVFLLSVSNLLPLAAYMAERFLYTPLIGWMIGFVGLLSCFLRRRVLVAVPVVCILIWSTIAWDRSQIWHDALTLFVRSSQEGPKTPRVEDNAVAAIFKLPHVQKAFRRDEKTKQIQVTGALSSAEAPSVIATFVKARELFPTNDSVTAAIAICYAMTGHPKEAIPLFEQVARKDPQNQASWNNLAQASLDARNYIIAGAALEKAAALNSADVKTLQLQVRLQKENGNAQAALDLLDRLRRIDRVTDYSQLFKEIEAEKEKSKP